MGMFSENYTGNRCSDCTWADNAEKNMVIWYKVRDKLPEFDEKGWAHELLLWDGDLICVGSCRECVLGDGDDLVDWWSDGRGVDAQLWAYLPVKPV